MGGRGAARTTSRFGHWHVMSGSWRRPRVADMKPSTPPPSFVHQPGSSLLRVAFVTETFPPELNGVAMTAGRLLNGLNTAGHKVRIIRPRQEGEDMAHVHCFSDLPTTLVRGIGVPGYNGIRFGLPAGGMLRRMWRQDRPDVVHILTEGPLGRSALHAARALKLPLVAGYHTHFDRYTEHYRFGLLRQQVTAYLRRFHNRCHVNLVPTGELVRQLQEGGMQNVRVLSRGVDKNQFNPALRSESLRQSWGVQADDLVMLCVGRLAAEKNLELVVQAWLAVRRSQPRAKLVLVGAGPEQERLSRQYPEVIFTGSVSSQELGMYYASADLFAFASMSETFGNVVQEAMASGLAVVGFDYAAAHELIVNGRNGILVPFDDAQAFVNATASLAQQPQLVRELGHVASLAGKSWQSVIQDLIAAYHDAIEMAHQVQEVPHAATRQRA